jgi:hypothetical protein
MRFSGLMIYHTFTIEMWVRPNAPGVLLSSNIPRYVTNNSEDLITFGLVGSPAKVFFRYSSYDSPYSVLINATNPANLDTGNWNLVAVSAGFTNNETSLKFLVNTVGSAETKYGFPIVDRPGAIHFLGTEQNTVNTASEFANFYAGYIYSFCILPTNTPDYTVNPNPSCQPFFCENCPQECLMNCEWNEYYNFTTFTCNPCDA